MARKKRPKPPVVPPLGPPQNLRPGGAHDDASVYDRKKEKAELRRELDDATG